jgi:haloacetate dehalogenase
MAHRADMAAARTISDPTLILWGEAFLGRVAESPVAIWRRTFAPEVVGGEVPGGHCNGEESPPRRSRPLESFLVG